MAELKTKQTANSVQAFMESIEDDKKRRDSQAILRLMQQATGAEPVMLGDSIIGFGSYHYKYASGREGDWPLAGFSPRKQNLTLYFMSGFEMVEPLLAKLGKYTTGKSCLYIKRIEDIDLQILAEVVRLSVDHLVKTNH